MEQIWPDGAASHAKRSNYGWIEKIYTAMDPDVQSSMENVFYNRKTVANKGVQAAMTVMDYKGRVVGVVGGLGEKQQNRGLNRAVSSKRQPGSSIKPLSIYAPAIENIFTIGPP